MARRRPPERIDQLVTSAVRVFTDRGYRRTQMADIARAMGVAPGTLYLYVESKEALFDLVIRRAWVDGDAGPVGALPHRTPRAGATLTRLRQRLRDETKLPTLERALRSPRT